MTRAYTNAEVDTTIADLMSKLPPGSYITTHILNEGRTVVLDVALPDSRRDTFEHGLVGFGGTKGGRSRLGHQGPPFDQFAVKAIVQWSKSK